MASYHAYRFPWWLQLVMNLPANAGNIRDMGSMSGLERSPGEGNGNLLHYSCLENSMDRGAWWVTTHGVSQARILEQVAISFSRGSSRPREGSPVSCVSCIGRLILHHWTLGSPIPSTAAATAAAKSLQSCPTLCDPIDSSPPVSPIPGILQARTLEWVLEGVR